MRTIVLFFLLLRVCCNTTLAQTHRGFKWMGPNKQFYEVIPNTQEFLLHTAKGEKQLLGVLKPAGIFSELPKDFDVSVFYQGDSVMFSIPGTGQVYSLYPQQLFVNRLDRTFFRGYNFAANQFMRNDTLYSIGGEGFWLAHSLVTYYNKRTKEWDLLNVQSKNPQPVSQHFSGFSSEKDAFFSAYLDPGKKPLEEPIHGFIFDFKRRSWEDQGPITTKLADFGKEQFRTAWTGNLLVCFYDPSEILLVDPFQNKLYTYTINTDKFFLPNSTVFYQNGYLYSRQYNNTKNDDLYLLDSIAVVDLLKNAQHIGPVYQSVFQRYRFLALYTLGALLLLVLFFWYKRKQKSTVNQLSEQERGLLGVFTQLKIDQQITSVELNSILGIHDKSYDNQRQIRNRIISSMNTKVKSVIQGKELILRVSSEEDKRMMNYYLNPELKTKDIELLKSTF